MLIGVETKSHLEWKWLIDGNWGRYGLYCCSIPPKQDELIGYKPKAIFVTACEHDSYPNFTQRVMLKDEPFKKLLGIEGERIYLYSENSNIWDNFEMLNSPEYCGEFDSDFGCARSCVIENPFKLEKQDLAKVARVYKHALEIGGMDYFYNYRYVEKYFEKFKLRGKTVVHAEGNFQGRPGCNSWNTGLGERKETVLDAIWKLEELAYIGCRILEIR